MANQPNRLEIRLDPNGVAAVAQATVTLAAHVVGTLLRALERDDLSAPEMQAGHFGYQFSGLEMEPSERREAFKNWVLSKGFQDLARGVRTTLEEAVLYLRTAAMKHGPLALVDADMPVIAIAPNDHLVDKLMSNMEEVRARGGELYLFADEGVAHGMTGRHVVSMPAAGIIAAPVVSTIPLQLLAYHIAVRRGCDVDQPRNLAKSVTVE